MKGSERFRHYDITAFTYIHLRLYVYTSPPLRIYVLFLTSFRINRNVLSWKTSRLIAEDHTTYRGRRHVFQRKSLRLPAFPLTTCAYSPVLSRQYPSSFQKHFRLSLQNVIHAQGHRFKSPSAPSIKQTIVPRRTNYSSSSQKL